MADIKQLGDALVNMTVKEVSELAGYLKEEYALSLLLLLLLLVLLLLVAILLLKSKRNSMLS